MIKTEEVGVAGSDQQLELDARDLARLYESDLRRQTELRRTTDAAVGSLMAALGARDVETEEHCRRIATRTVAVGRAMEMSEPDLVTLEQAAVLHDVGKIGVPDAILRKPGPLTDDEWVEMREHPELGYRILRDHPSLGRAAPIVRHHHERYDGGGYPDHLRSDAIPLGARIVAVVDAFDAMTSHRPYRAAMHDDAAIAEIVRGRGGQFDPIVVDRFVDLVAAHPQQRVRRIAGAICGQTRMTFVLDARPERSIESPSQMPDSSPIVFDKCRRLKPVGRRQSRLRLARLALVLGIGLGLLAPLLSPAITPIAEQRVASAAPKGTQVFLPGVQRGTKQTSDDRGPKPTPESPSTPDDAAGQGSDPTLPGTVLWSADHETGDLTEWWQGQDGKAVYSTGTGDVAVVNTLARSGRYSLALSITDASEGIKQAARIFRWDGIPSSGYYGAWFYFPQKWVPSQYWNIMQWKSKLSYEINDPLWILNIANRSDGSMYFYLWDWIKGVSYEQTPVNVPVGRWVHVEAYYQQALDNTGQVTIWQDGVQILDARDVTTRRPNDEMHWSINNYTSGIAPSSATIYVDDASIGTRRTGS